MIQKPSLNEDLKIKTTDLESCQLVCHCDRYYYCLQICRLIISLCSCGIFFTIKMIRKYMWCCKTLRFGA